jgi:hypothetical protein
LNGSDNLTKPRPFFAQQDTGVLNERAKNGVRLRTQAYAMRIRILKILGLMYQTHQGAIHLYQLYRAD